jgi:hypothetical protein
MVLPTMGKVCFLNNDINYRDTLKVNTLITALAKCGGFFVSNFYFFTDHLNAVLQPLIIQV